MQKTKSLIVLYYVLVITTSFCWAQNIAPILTATGNQAYCPQSQINIVTGFNIVDPDDAEIDALFIQISIGYVQGEDSLTLMGSHPSILTSWDAIQGKLTFLGNVSAPVSYIDLIAATEDIVFQSTNNNPTDKTFSISIGDANYLPLTDHYYEYVPSIGILWTSAKTAAENRTYFGLQGYLATVTSDEEQRLTGEQTTGAGWIGGSDAEVEGVWKWVTGPETGTVFWNGLANGSTSNYAYWNSGEPNQFGGREEDYAHITVVGIPGSWNDLTNTGDASGDFQPKGYVVEYGGMPGDPILNISASSSIYNISIVNTTPDNRCGSGTVNLEATASQGDVLWFTTSTGGTPIFNGPVFTTPILGSTRTYYALASINGCVNGQRVPVNANINQIPTINSINDDSVCESGSGILSATASVGTINWYDASSGGIPINAGTSFTTPNVNATTTYYVDATLNGCTTLSRTPVTLTVQKTPLPTANALQTFCDIQNATIADLLITGDNIQWYTTSAGGTSLNITETLINNTTYYATQTVNNCESALRLPFNVEVYETVVALPSTDIPILTECDTNEDGDDTNGFSTFDLTLNETTLLNGKMTADFTLSYFTDVARNISILTPLNTFENTIKDNQTIYVRISNNIDSSCYTDVSFDIKVIALPEIESSIVFKNCDEDGNPDGITDFNLNEANDVITNNNASGLTITYHLSIGDANSNIDAVNSTSFNNSISNTVYARVENPSGCYRVSVVSLQVSTTAFPSNYLEILRFCDDDSTIDGFREFDLTQAAVLFLAQFPLGQNLSVHYFRNLSDAQLEQNEIISQTNYVNEDIFNQVLYVRVESDDNGDCFGIGPHLALIVNPRPEFEVDQTETYCLDNKPIILTTFNPKDNYTYEWKDENGIVVSNSPDATVFSGGTYSVIATSNFSCQSFPVSFTVVQSAKASIDIDDITIVELSDNNSIMINNDNNNLGIGDYEFALDDINGSFRDEPFFDRVGAGSHTIYVKDKNKCGIAELEVFILGFPKFFTPNEDGHNDVWKIKGLGLGFSNASTVSVYDRYGKLIKQINAKNGEWAGRFNGELLPVSDYWFIAELVDITTGNIKIYRGHFSLIR